MKSSVVSFILKSVFTLLTQTQHIFCLTSVPGIKLRAPNPREEHSIFPDFKAMSGGRAELACNVSLPSSDDAITLILWYRADTSGVPIYTVDARTGSLEQAKHTSMQSIFSNGRAQFDVSVRPAVLKIDPVFDNDGMEYRCRVDYRWGRTASTYITLIVIVPPRNIIIKNEKNQIQNGLIGPYNEGMDVRLVCIAEGGRPTPYVHWYRDNELIDDTYSFGTTNNTVHNDLLINKLSRSMFNSVLSCSASNNLTKAITLRASLDINLKPIDVEIISPRHTLNAGTEVELTCESRGSRPPAQITWYKNNQELSHSRESISHDGNVTTSLLKLNPQVSDDGSYLSCRAENLRLANSWLEDGWKLNVLYAPNVSLLYRGQTIDTFTVNEADEIVIECSVRANPLAKIVLFLHDGIQLVSDSQSGIIANNSSLVITSAKSIHRGNYQCLAINTQGKGMSQEIKVNVQYSPICRNISTTVRTRSLTKDLKLLCEVDAQPSDVQFRWTSNTSQNNFNDFTNDGLTSILTLKPTVKQDSEVIQCWASNVVGHNRLPCLYVLIAPTRPQPVTDCQILNVTTVDLVIECSPGTDGGLIQSFQLEVFNNTTSELIMNQTNDEKPLFIIGGLSSKTTYRGIVYSMNELGKSDTIGLTLQTMKLFNKKLILDSPQPDVYDLWTAIISGLLLVLILLSIIITIICKIRVRDRQKDSKQKEVDEEMDEEFNTVCNQSLKNKFTDNQNFSIFLVPNSIQNRISAIDNTSNDRDIRNPDLIPEIYGFEVESSVDSSQTPTSIAQSIQPNGDISHNKYQINLNQNTKQVLTTNQNKLNANKTIVASNCIQIHSTDSFDIYTTDLNQTVLDENIIQTSNEYPLTTAV